jgi:hypothetical protein
MNKDEALQMCLEYIETDAHERKYVRHAIKQALAAPVQEPVAWIHVDAYQPSNRHLEWKENCKGYEGDWVKHPLYTTPPAQPAPVQDINWKDMYEKEKRRREMWVAKYEKDIGPLEYAVPVAAPVQEPVAGQPLPCPFCGHIGLDFSDGETYRWGIASCGGCGASCGDVRREYPDQGEWHAEAIAEWNRRSPAAPDLQAELDATNRQVEILSDALAESRREVTWGVDWGRAGDKACVSIIKRLPNGKIEVVAVEYQP